MNDFLVLLLSFAAFVLAHILLLQIVGPDKFIRNGGLLLLPFLFLPFLSIGMKLIFISLWNMYMFALICARNSVSLRILDEVLRAPAETLSKPELLDRFSDRESLGSRLELMQKNSFLHRVAGGEVELSAKGKLLARGILLARAILGVPKSGIDPLSDKNEAYPTEN